jgi:hypothetical protein
MEAICSSETSVATQETTRRHIPEDDTLHNHRCENLKSYNMYIGLSVVNSTFFSLFNRILGKEGIFDQYRLTRYYEKPHQVM